MDVPEDVIDAAALAALRERFHEAHERLYGYALRSATVELVNLRVTVSVPLPKAQAGEIGPQVGSVEEARVGERQVYFGRAFGRAGGSGLGTGGAGLGWLPTPRYDRAQLGAGAVVVGPAILEQLDSTTVLGPGQRGTVDRFGHLIVTSQAP